MTTTAEVPGKYMVGLNGRPYMADLKSGEYRHVTIPQLRPQADTSDEVGGGSLNPEALWRRSQESWHLGAGQTYFDKAEASPHRFRSSKGIDPWTKWQISILKDTDKKKDVGVTGGVQSSGVLTVAGSYLYYYDYATVKLYYTQDITVDSPTWTEVTGLPADRARAMTTDGVYVYTAHGANGIYRTTVGGATSSSWVTGSVTGIGFAKGRLMATYNQNLYNVTAAGALPAALLAHPNGWSWSGITAGTNNIYVGAYSLDKSLIYRTQVKADGTALDVPVVAGELPDGERLETVYGYLGFVLIGTDKGVRFSTADSNGNLTIGALIETPQTVYAFEGQGQYVWFSWSAYDATSSGLGRMDLTGFSDVEGLVPAYASDLMVTVSAHVQSIVTFQDLRVFFMLGSGVWAETSTYVTSGTIDSGLVTYGLHDQKVAHFLDVRFSGSTVNGTIAASLAPASGTFASAGSHTGAGSTDEFTLANIQSDVHEVRLVLTRGSTTTTPVVTRWTLKSDVVAPAGYYIYVPLLISDADDVGHPEDKMLATELAAIHTLRTNRTVVDYQEGATTYSVKVEDFEFRAARQSNLPHQNGAFSGTALVKLKVVT